MVMVDLWHGLRAGPDPPKEVNVVIELTRGSRNKYEYDARSGVFKLNRVLYTYFPCDYGFIPRTLDDDGDPLDAVLGPREARRCALNVLFYTHHAPPVCALSRS